MGLQQTITYDVAGNFSFDSSLIEIVGGPARLKDLTPADATFYASFQASLNGDYGAGSLSGTATGAIPTPSGYLDLTGSTLKYLDFAAALNLNSLQAGAVRVVVQPNYSGAPVSQQNFFYIFKSPTTNADSLFLYHYTTGHLGLVLYPGAGSPISGDLGAWSPVAGTDYEFEVDYDCTLGTMRLWINGVQFGSTITGTGTATNTQLTIRLGSNSDGNTTSNFKLRDFILFSTVQHTAGFAGEIPRARETAYSLADPSIRVSSGVWLDGLESFSAITSTPSNSDVKFQLVLDGAPYWWTGTAWATSDGSYAESNTAAEIETNAAALDVSAGVDLQVQAVLHSLYGNAQPSITQAVLGYNFFDPPEVPDKCLIYGYVRDVLGDVDPGTAKIVMELEEGYFSGVNYIKAQRIEIAVNASGYFEETLVESTAARRSYTVSVQYQKDGLTITEELGAVMIPAADSASLHSLL